MSDIHTCSYYCDRPACIKAQRDELRDRFQVMQAALQSGEPVARDDAPPNSLPSYKECVVRVENSRYIEQRVGGGYEPDENVKLPSQLHKFIYEYDDADPYKSAWFLHRLELLINEIASANTAPQPVVDRNELIELLIATRAQSEGVTADLIIKLLSAGKETENCTHSVAILTEKWDDKTVTSAPFCIKCGKSPLAGKGGE